MLFIRLSISSRMASSNSFDCPKNFRCGIFTESFFFLVKANPFHLAASGFSDTCKFSLLLPFPPFFFW